MTSLKNYKIWIEYDKWVDWISNQKSSINKKSLGSDAFQLFNSAKCLKDKLYQSFYETGIWRWLRSET